MCLGIPMQVVEADGNVAYCRGRQGLVKIDATLVAPIAVGDWLMTFLGHAREHLTAEQAAQIDRALDALDAVQRGETNLDAYFQDLIDREPQLPEHLRNKA